MNINTNMQSFSSQNGIKLIQNIDSTQSTNQSKSLESVSLSIDSKTLDSLNLLSSLEEQTFIKARLNGFISDEDKAIRNRLEEVYSKVTKENKRFADPEKHIYNKYYNISYTDYAKGYTSYERKASYEQEMSYLKNGRIGKIYYYDPNLKDLNAIDGLVEPAQEKAFNRDAVNKQFQQLLDRYKISIPKDTNIRFTIEPYDYKVSVSGLDDKNLSSLIEEALNSADNSKELFRHISSSRSSNIDDSIQFNKEKEDKYSIFHEIKDKTGYDLRDLDNINGKFITKDGTDILELYKQGVINSKKIPEEYKGVVFEIYSSMLSEVAQKGFDNVDDLALSIDYKDGSFHDIGQSETYGVGKRDWIDTLRVSRSTTLGEVFKGYTDNLDIESKQDIIRNALNLKDMDFVKSKADSLFDKYGTNDIELIKLILMQKYLLGKEDDEATKEFFKLLKELEESKDKEQ